MTHLTDRIETAPWNGGGELGSDPHASLMEERANQYYHRTGREYISSQNVPATVTFVYPPLPLPSSPCQSDTNTPGQCHRLHRRRCGAATMRRRLIPTKGLLFWKVFFPPWKKRQQQQQQQQQQHHWCGYRRHDAKNESTGGPRQHSSSSTTTPSHPPQSPSPPPLCGHTDQQWSQLSSLSRDATAVLGGSPVGDWSSQNPQSNVTSRTELLGTIVTIRQKRTDRLCKRGLIAMLSWRASGEDYEVVTNGVDLGSDRTDMQEGHFSTDMHSTESVALWLPERGVCMEIEDVSSHDQNHYNNEQRFVPVVSEDEILMEEKTIIPTFTPEAVKDYNDEDVSLPEEDMKPPAVPNFDKRSSSTLDPGHFMDSSLTLDQIMCSVISPDVLEASVGCWIEVTPDCSVPLRGGSVESLRYIEEGRAIATQNCWTCEGTVHCLGDASLVMCPHCRVVQQVEEGFASHTEQDSMTLALGFSTEDWARMAQTALRQHRVSY